MIPAYYRPASVNEALKLKAELGPGAHFLAGGTEVNNLHSRRPSALIDLAALGLETLESTPEGLRIGAAVTFQQLLEHEGTPGFLKAAASQMTNRNIRNRATVGGQLATNRSCADLIPTLLAAEARVLLSDHELPLEEYLKAPSGLILAIHVPATKRGFGLGNQTRTAADISIINAAVSAELDGQILVHPIVAVGGVAKHVVRLHSVESALHGHAVPAAQQVESLIAGAVQPIDDVRGSAAYKRHLASVLGQRALQAAVSHCLSARGA